MHDKYIISVIILFVSVAVLGVLAPGELGADARGFREPARLKEWQYRLGDSPKGADGTYQWLPGNDAGVVWRDIPSMMTPPDAGDQNFAWYRIRLPRTNWSNPIVYFPPVAVAFEVYLDADRIYQFGVMRPDAGNKYTMVSVHLISLPEGYQGKMLSVRVFSSVGGIIGVGGYGEDVLVGSERDIVREIFKTSAETTLLGLLFIVVGLFSVLLGIRRFGGTEFFSLSFGGFAVFFGMFFLFMDAFPVYLIESPDVKYYGRYVSYFLFPIGLYIFLQQIAGANRVIKGLWMTHIAAAVVAIALDLTGVLPFPLIFVPFNFLFIGTLVVATYLAVRAAVGGNRNARLFVWGFTALCLTGLSDILVGLGHIPYWRWVSHWGALVFILYLTYILARRIRQSHLRLQAYSQELEQKSEELQEYSQTLERRVAERTEDLDSKNKELENTLGQLKKTQQQLVLKEKMASLGDLVAGVAHEMNNPIGAINSASDVSNRCLDRLQEIIEQGVSVDAILANRRYRTAMQLLKENTRIAVEGSGRVTRIISSLKNFARLDEAELQEADIHEGIESTLTLVHHELKNTVEVVKDFGDIPRIRCYPNRLNQVFMNLFVNAVHAIEDKGILEINTSADDKNVYIRVADNGKGISPEIMDKIFDPGFTTKGAGVGTGLGLSISYSIIEKHGGTIQVESEAGRGTEFIITLPI